MGRMEGTDEQTPVTGVVVQSYSGHSGTHAVPRQHVVVTQEADSSHYVPACLATGFCGPFGLLGTALMCPTNHGFMGASVGCGVASFCRAVALMTLLLLSYYGYIACDVRTVPTEISFDECVNIQGDWEVLLSTSGRPQGCYNACPSGLTWTNHTEAYSGFYNYCEDNACVDWRSTDYIVNVSSAIFFMGVSLYFAKHYAARIAQRRADVAPIVV